MVFQVGWVKTKQNNAPLRCTLLGLLIHIQTQSTDDRMYLCELLFFSTDKLFQSRQRLVPIRNYFGQTIQTGTKSRMLLTQTQHGNKKKNGIRHALGDLMWRVDMRIIRFQI